MTSSEEWVSAARLRTKTVKWCLQTSVVRTGWTWSSWRDTITIETRSACCHGEQFSTVWHSQRCSAFDGSRKMIRSGSVTVPPSAQPGTKRPFEPRLSLVSEPPAPQKQKKKFFWKFCSLWGSKCGKPQKVTERRKFSPAWQLPLCHAVKVDGSVCDRVGRHATEGLFVCLFPAVFRLRLWRKFWRTRRKEKKTRWNKKIDVVEKQLLKLEFL